MPDFDLPYLVYLSLFLAVIGGSYLLSQRRNIGRTLQYAGIWVLIFLGAILAVGAWDEISGIVAPQAAVSRDGDTIRVPQAPDGHFYVTLEVNGADVRFVVDTGATEIVLRPEDAERAGIDPGALIFSGRAVTANGVVETAPVTLDRVSFGPFEETRVRALVNGAPLQESLLGMGFLGRFARLEIADGELILTR
ncbi:TIGR02281 family clan AA aspartic protease [Rhodobacterales bacterium HKCCE2091]|nr:TIGR02281 family clan AA aspartic protease [Rhodobacterales bacterium HKCCE2091]